MSAVGPPSSWPTASVLPMSTFVFDDLETTTSLNYCLTEQIVAMN
jgi:hypothetical protein